MLCQIFLAVMCNISHWSLSDSDKVSVKLCVVHVTVNRISGSDHRLVGPGS